MGTGTVFHGTGMVWQNLTCGLPVLNPTCITRSLKTVGIPIPVQNPSRYMVEDASTWCNGMVGVQRRTVGYLAVNLRKQRHSVTGCNGGWPNFLEWGRV